MAIERRLSVVTGGPGTDKTTTVAAAVAALLAQDAGLKVALCAPTGKAAAQLRKSIAEQKEIFSGKGVPLEILEALPSKASPIHRLLGWSPSQECYKRNANSPIDADVVIVDEASMMPLSQAFHLFDATHGNAKVILLGDKDQLASVDAGNVFGDICGALTGTKHLVELRRRHRFKKDGGIFRLKRQSTPETPTWHGTSCAPAQMMCAGLTPHASIRFTGRMPCSNF